MSAPSLFAAPAAVAAPRPWLRYWARMIDLVLYAFVIGIADELLHFGFQSAPGLLVEFLLAVTWVPFEAAFLTFFRATPGKWILHTEVTGPDHGKLPFRLSLQRAFHVMVKGRGAGIPILALVQTWQAYGELRDTGITPWDEELRTEVHHLPFRWYRLALLAVLLIGCVTALVLLANLDVQE